MSTESVVYGTWASVDRYSTSVEQTVRGAFNEDYAADFDLTSTTLDYREAINAALPEGVSLVLNDFIGPDMDGHKFPGYPTTPQGRLDVRAIVERVSLWKIAGRYDLARRIESIAEADKEALIAFNATRDALKATVLSALASGMTEVRACELSGLSRSTIRAWQGK